MLAAPLVVDHDADPLKFRDTKRYTDRIKAARKAIDADNSGVLLYLQLAERRVEIVRHYGRVGGVHVPLDAAGFRAEVNEVTSNDPREPCCTSMSSTGASVPLAMSAPDFISFCQT